MIFTGTSIYSFSIFLSIIGHSISDNPISITISPWSDCDPIVCVQTRNVYCLDSNGNVEPESACPGIDELKHYQECDCSKRQPSQPQQPKHNKPNHNNNNHNNNYGPPTFSPTFRPTHAPTHDRDAFYPDDEKELSDDGEESGMLVNGDVLTTLVEQTKMPTLAPTLRPSFERTLAPTTNQTRFQHLKEIRQRHAKDTLDAQSFSRVEMVGIVALLSFMLIFVIFLAMFCCSQPSSPDISGDYTKVDQAEEDDFEFPEDRDNPFEYFNEPEEKENEADLHNELAMIEMVAPSKRD